MIQPVTSGFGAIFKLHAFSKKRNSLIAQVILVAGLLSYCLRAGRFSFPSAHPVSQPLRKTFSSTFEIVDWWSPVTVGSHPGARWTQGVLRGWCASPSTLLITFGLGRTRWDPRLGKDTDDGIPKLLCNYWRKERFPKATWDRNRPNPRWTMMMILMTRLVGQSEKSDFS